MATWKKIALSGEITNADLSGSAGITSANIANGTIATADVADDAITAAKIAADSVTVSELDVTGTVSATKVVGYDATGTRLAWVENAATSKVGDGTNADLEWDMATEDLHFNASNGLTVSVAEPQGGGDITVGFGINSIDASKIDGGTFGAGNYTMPADLTVTGDLTVNGTTTEVSTANLLVQDKNIVLGEPDSAFADDAAAVAANTGGGISIVTDSATAGNYANITWNTSKFLTGWCVEDTANVGHFEVAVMQYSANSTAPTTTEDAAGIGSFHFDSGDDKLYIRTA